MTAARYVIYLSDYGSSQYRNRLPPIRLRISKLNDCVDRRYLSLVNDLDQPLQDKIGLVQSG